MLHPGLRSPSLARLCRSCHLSTTRQNIARNGPVASPIMRSYISKPDMSMKPQSRMEPTSMFRYQFLDNKAHRLPLSLASMSLRQQYEGSSDHGRYGGSYQHGKCNQHLLSAVLLGPIYISLALMSGEGLQDRDNEANIWANIVSDVVSPPKPASPSAYSDLAENLHADVQGYNVEDKSLVDEEDESSEAQRWLAHMERYFRMGAYHLGVYFRTEDIVDHGSLTLSGDAEMWYGSIITSKLISAEDDVPPASLEAQAHDRDQNPRTAKTAPGRFVLAQIAFHDIGTEEYHSPDTITEKEEFRPGKCAGAILDDFEKRLHEIGASRALLITLDDDTYHTVYWDGRRFVTVLFLEFTPLP